MECVNELYKSAACCLLYEEKGVMSVEVTSSWGLRGTRQQVSFNRGRKSEANSAFIKMRAFCHDFYLDHAESPFAMTK